MGKLLEESDDAFNVHYFSRNPYFHVFYFRTQQQFIKLRRNIFHKQAIFLFFLQEH